MIYYKLTDLLVFLEECKADDYNPIEDILEALNDHTISEGDRIGLALAIFKYHGLKRVFISNETYLLEDILFFFQRQTQDNYSVIEAIVNLIEFKSDYMPDSEKDKVILDTLGKYGLFEIGYDGDRSFLEKISALPQPAKRPEEDIQWEHNVFEAQLEFYNIRLLNTVVEFQSFMN